ncbi:hypothetical protein B0H16DRAFT_1465550 [Mycena metata]|uniref:Zn(2)-C6 fungal-type domain-containing protein n=1 Tax=Mycena metata TaxID=1033252 RepID=A0AAD7IBC5_9AGAR|nr:hypothetical protein B0H16DRAFT_1465550 [Mycena metata]
MSTDTPLSWPLPRKPLRTRRAQACTECRARRIKCVTGDDATSAPCERCIRRGFTCKFVPVTGQQRHSPPTNEERPARKPSESIPTFQQELASLMEYSNFIAAAQLPDIPVPLLFSSPPPISLPPKSCEWDYEPNHHSNRPAFTRENSVLNSDEPTESYQPYSSELDLESAIFFFYPDVMNNEISSTLLTSSVGATPGLDIGNLRQSVPRRESSCQIQSIFVDPPHSRIRLLDPRHKHQATFRSMCSSSNQVCNSVAGGQNLHTHTHTTLAVPEASYNHHKRVCPPPPPMASAEFNVA